MTKINLHGILKYEFGEVMPLSITRTKEIIDAIDTVKKDFRARIYELARQNIHFNIIADGESVKDLNQLEMKKNFKQIDIVPVIAGAIDPITIIIQIAILIVSMAIQYAMRPKPPKIEQQQLQSEVSSQKGSFIFSNRANLTQQGQPVPVGYGRLRVGSSTIQATIKSYPQKEQIGDVLAEPGNKALYTNQISASASS
jgi:predicted phage tail protein